jgi:hypothetical protein
LVPSAAGKLPEGTASTAAVKPAHQVTGSVVGAYEQSCDDLLATINAAGDLRTSSRYAHPWFGPLDAAGWHALAASHLGIHRGQIERIRGGLPASKDRNSPPTISKRDRSTSPLRPQNANRRPVEAIWAGIQVKPFVDSGLR